MDKNSHKIGVYISICSTKIPYGGPNKEYIGDENEDLQRAVSQINLICMILNLLVGERGDHEVLPPVEVTSREARSHEESKRKEEELREVHPFRLESSHWNVAFHQSRVSRQIVRNGD